MSNIKKNYPLKWIKHIMLVFWNLRNINDLQTTIHRFRIDDYENCLKRIEQEIEHSIDKESYIIKLIYSKKFYKLPNYIINSRDDLKKVKQKISSTEKCEFCEIWYCKYNTDSILYGRILYELNSPLPKLSKSKIEMVWGDSARIIEKYPDINCSFLSMESENMYDYKILRAIYNDRYPDEIHETANSVLKKLYSYNKYIIDFCNFLEQCGCMYVSVEFAYKKDGNLTIIDWDSNDDILGIKKFMEIYEADYTKLLEKIDDTNYK